MSTVRSSSLIEKLQTAFQNPEIKKKCCTSSIKFLERHIATRVFDEFPPLLSQENFKELSYHFKDTLAQIRHVEQSHDGFELSKKNNSDKDKIIAWEKTIAAMGRQELLDKDGHVKHELIKLLGWEKYSAQLKGRDVVCAYVGAVNMQVMDSLSDFIYEHTTAFTAVCNFVNKNYRTWVTEMLKAFGLFSKEDEKEDHGASYSILRWPTKKESLIIGLLAGVSALIFGAAAYQSLTKKPEDAKDVKQIEAKPANTKH